MQFCSHLNKNSPFINNKLYTKVLQYYLKTCIQRCFEFFEKNSFIKKSLERSKFKRCKKRYHKKSATKVFQVCKSIVYDSFFLELALALVSPLLRRYCKIRTSFRTLVSYKTTIWRLKKSDSNDKFLEKITSSSYHMEQNTFIEASCISNIHTGGNIFCSCCY